MFIHSRDSVTGQLTIGEAVSAFLIRTGVSDPSRSRATYAPEHGGLVRVSCDANRAREAEIGSQFRHLRMIDLVRHAAQLDGVRFADDSPAVVLNTVYNHCSQTRAGFSTGNMDSLFVDCFATAFNVGWDAQGDSTLGWVAESETLSVKRTARLRLGGVQLTLQPRGGGRARKLCLRKGRNETLVLHRPSPDR